MIVEPGESRLCAARFSVRLPVFLPTPPAIATISPVSLSMITIPDCSCCELAVSGIWLRSSYTASTAACASGLYVL